MTVSLMDRILGGVKHLSVERLAELLSQVPAGSELHPNGVGNITILSKEFKPLGFIDFMGNGSVILDRFDPIPDKTS